MNEVLDLEGRLLFKLSIAQDEYRRAIKDKLGVEEATREYKRALEEFSILVYSRL